MLGQSQRPGSSIEPKVLTLQTLPQNINCIGWNNASLMCCHCLLLPPILALDSSWFWFIWLLVVYLVSNCTGVTDTGPALIQYWFKVPCWLFYHWYDHALDSCCAIAYNADPTLNRHCVGISCVCIETRGNVTYHYACCPKNTCNM